jgi:hypothetical protein
MEEEEEDTNKEEMDSCIMASKDKIVIKVVTLACIITSITILKHTYPHYNKIPYLSLICVTCDQYELLKFVDIDIKISPCLKVSVRFKSYK